MAFQKGQSGNPGGKHRDKPFRDALIMAIKEAGEDHKALRMIAVALLDKAATGDVQAIRELADRVDGKVPQGLEHSGEVQNHVIYAPVPLEADQWQEKYKTPTIQ